MQQYTKERRIKGETQKDFGQRFCSKYIFGQYINPCGGDFYSISCLLDNRCMVLIDGEPCNPVTDYCGKCN